MSCHEDCCRQDDGIVSRVLGRRSVKSAHKPHMCVWCGRVIPAGSAYQVTVALVDGDFYTEKRHRPYDTACGI